MCRERKILVLTGHRNAISQLSLACKRKIKTFEEMRHSKG